MSPASRRVFIAGCGYVGYATALRLHAAGFTVIAGTRSGIIEGAPFPVVACDLADPATLAAIGPVDVVIHAASSSRGGEEEYRVVYLEGARHLLETLRPQQMIFTSSTSVYAQTDGAWVSEQSPAEPGRATGRILREAEETVLAANGCVARLAGIYGPGRSVLLRRFFNGEAVIEGDGERMVNQIHRDDAAGALARLVEAEARGIFNVADDTPLTQREVYTWLATHFGKPVPPTGPVNTQRKRGVTHKRVSNAKLHGLQWTPTYPSFRDAVLRDPNLVRLAQIPEP